MKIERLTAKKTGENVIVDGLAYTVAQPCSEKHKGHWYCATHNEGFENQLQKDFHISQGKHTLVWICHQHGPEQP